MSIPVMSLRTFGTDWRFDVCNLFQQPLILFSFADYVVRLHVTERYIYIYIYNTGSYETIITLILYVDICIIRVHM